MTVKKLIILLIKIYQKYFSPLFLPRCRFYPSCSDYAISAIEKRGIIAGVALVIWRIFRCNPYFPGGYDPID